MDSKFDQQLELAITRELKALPELTAPAAVADRVRATLEHRLNHPWYRRSWAAWPVPLQATALAAMLALFGGLCLAGWELSQAEMVAQAGHRIGQWFSGLNTFSSLLNVLAGSVVQVVKKLGMTFMIACLVAAGLGYALFLSLGTVYFRLAFAKRQTSHL